MVDRVGVITFTRPERRNALHEEMYAPMIAAIEEFAADPDVGCVVVTGEGSAFCAGGDVRDAPQPPARRIAADARAADRQPDGQLAGVGAPARGADRHDRRRQRRRRRGRVGDRPGLRSAHRRRVGALHRRMGAAGVLRRLRRAVAAGARVGPSRALDLLATNATVDAGEALELGIVDRVVADDEFGAAWMEWAAQFAAGPQTAIGYIKQNILNACRMTLAEAIAIEAEHQVDSSLTDDHREAVRAWMEKRDPVFGRTECERSRA